MSAFNSLTPADLVTVYQVMAAILGLTGVAWVASAVRLALRSK